MDWLYGGVAEEGSKKVITKYPSRLAGIFVYCMRWRPSQRTFQVPSLGKPGLRGWVQPSHPAHIMAMAERRAPLPGR